MPFVPVLANIGFAASMHLEMNPKNYYNYLDHWIGWIVFSLDLVLQETG
jgi:hypothetical protein